MELSDYDILGITQKASFRIVKNAYYDLSRIYHPDSPQIIIGMSKEDRLVAFQRIQKAYENIKEKLNVVEIDLPQEEIEYNDDKFDKPVILKNNQILEDSEFNKKFNAEFEKQFSHENIDNPFSIHYKEPEENKRNLQDSKIILKSSSSVKKTQHEEFGVNYIEDHSCENYLDIRNIDNRENLKDIKDVTESIKETIDKDLENKLEKMLKDREEVLELTEEDISFMSRQKQIQKEIEESKRKVSENRNIMYLVN